MLSIYTVVFREQDLFLLYVGHVSVRVHFKGVCYVRHYLNDGAVQMGG